MLNLILRVIHRIICSTAWHEVACVLEGIWMNIEGLLTLEPFLRAYTSVELGILPIEIVKPIYLEFAKLDVKTLDEILKHIVTLRHQSLGLLLS
jgi:hypothetical protein